MSGSPGIHFTKQQQDEWCAIAVEHGVNYAVQAMGYPAVRTGYIWLEQRHLEPPKTALAVAAMQVKLWYGDAEKRTVLQQILDDAHELLVAGTSVLDRKLNMKVRRPLEPKQLQSVASTVRQTITTLQMLDGLATEIVQNNVLMSANPEILAALEEARAKNQVQINQLKVA